MALAYRKKCFYARVLDRVEALEYCSDGKANRQKKALDSSAPFVGGERYCV